MSETSADAPNVADAAVDLTKAVLDCCAKHQHLPSGAPQAHIEQHLATLKASKMQTMETLNTLLSSHKIVACHDHIAQALSFKIAPTVHDNDDTKTALSQWHGLTPDDGLVLQEITAVGSDGVRSKELRARTNLQQQQLTKALRKLESRGLVHSVKSIAAKNQKLYLPAGVEPSNEVTGGAWYTAEQEFDHAFVDVLQTASLDYIQHSKTYSATAQQVHDHISSSGLIRGKPISLDDVIAVLDSLVYDAKLEILEPRGDAGGALAASRAHTVFRQLQTEPVFRPYSVPCGVCPVADDCHPGGEVNPAGCMYLTKWLDMATVDGQGSGGGAAMLDF